MSIGLYLPDVITFAVGLVLMLAGIITFINGFGVGIPGKKLAFAVGFAPWIVYLGFFFCLAGVMLQVGHWAHL